MNCIEYSHEIILAQLVDVVIYNQLQASEASCNYLFTLNQLWRLANGHYDQSPSLVS